MKVKGTSFFIIVLSVILVCLLALFGVGDSIKGVKKIRLGIDIRGGI